MLVRRDRIDMKDIKSGLEIQKYFRRSFKDGRAAI